MYRVEAGETFLCSKCSTARNGSYRCRDCFGGSTLCKGCIVDAHQQMPFHHVEEWTDESYFRRVSLGDLGLAIHCGHSGRPCENGGGEKPHEVRIVDKNGSFTFNVYECYCEQSGKFWEQLFLMRLFPATYDNPRTAFTFAALADYQTLNYAAKVSLWDYWGSIQRRTDGVQWKLVQVRGATY